MSQDADPVKKLKSLLGKLAPNLQVFTLDDFSGIEEYSCSAVDAAYIDRSRREDH